MILRYGLGAEELAWSLAFILLPLSCVYYPVSVPGPLQPVALALPPTHVFEGMRSILLHGVFEKELWWALGLNAMYLAIGYLSFRWFLQSAKVNGTLVQLRRVDARRPDRFHRRRLPDRRTLRGSDPAPHPPHGGQPVQSRAPRLVGGPFSLVGADGKTVTDADFHGRYMLVFFGFTHCPDICPAELQVIAQALDKLGDKGKKVVPVFITLDPERDTPRAMADYLKSFGPNLWA